MDRPRVVSKMGTVDQLLEIVKQGVCRDASTGKQYTDCHGVLCEQCILDTRHGEQEAIQWIKDTLL